MCYLDLGFVETFGLLICLLLIVLLKQEDVIWEIRRASKGNTFHISELDLRSLMLPRGLGAVTLNPAWVCKEIMPKGLWGHTTFLGIQGLPSVGEMCYEKCLYPSEFCTRLKYILLVRHSIYGKSGMKKTENPSQTQNQIIIFLSLGLAVNARRQIGGILKK